MIIYDFIIELINMHVFDYFIIEFYPILKKTLPVVKIWREVDCIEHLKEKFNQTQRSWLNVITFYFILVF